MSAKVSWEEINIWTGKLSKVDFPPQCVLASSNFLNRIRNWLKKIILSAGLWAGTSVFPYFWTRTLTRTYTHHWLSWISSLLTVDLGLFRLHNYVISLYELVYRTNSIYSWLLNNTEFELLWVHFIHGLFSINTYYSITQYEVGWIL